MTVSETFNYIPASREIVFTEIDDQDSLADRQFVVDDTATLAERVGPDTARAYMQDNSVSYMTRLGAARRLGKLHRPRS